jgi:molybdopterin-guanine dinucleotide biosynthesis protein A
MLSERRERVRERVLPRASHRNGYDVDVRPPQLEHVTLAVLAGGAGSRMGSPKSLLRVGKTPILEFLMERLAWPGPTLLITSPGREEPPGADRFEREACDAVADEGPLRGVYTALTHATTPVLVVVGVDMPAVTLDDLAWFVKELAARPAAAGVMTARDGQIEPLPCALRPALALGLVSDHLAGGRRSLHGLAKDGEIKLVDAAGALPERAWTNVNTPGDWERFLAGLK